MPRLAMIASCILISGCVALPDIWRASEETQPVLQPVPLFLETTGGTTCNGVRLDRRTVATAAHCLEEGTSIDIFEAGGVSRTADTRVHPAYDLMNTEQAAGLDLAKIFVISPVDAPGRLLIRPIEPGPVEILVVTKSGAFRRIPCSYLGRSATLVEMSCAVSLGWSGAPIVQNGALVGILSARGQDRSIDIVQMAEATRLNTF